MTGVRSVVNFTHLGPTRHGVRRYGELLDRAVSRCVASGPSAPVAHLQFSDHLVDVDEFERIVLTLRSGRPNPRIVATFHDCPGVGHDEPWLDVRRAATYARAAALVDTVVVCSDHERRALQGTGLSAPIAVIAHLVEEREIERRRTRRPCCPTVGVLGFIYPGKGHEQVVDGCVRSERSPEVVVLGGPSRGHEGLADELDDRARAQRVPCRVTGWLDETELDRWLARVDVPVLAHPAPSASGSLATWLSAGRRPLVAASPYTRELDRLAPDAISLYDPAAGPACRLSRSERLKPKYSGATTATSY